MSDSTEGWQWKKVVVVDLPDSVRMDLVEWCGDKVYSDLTTDEIHEAENRISEMTAYEAFDTWLRYEGILGYTPQILNALKGLGALKTY